MIPKHLQKWQQILNENIEEIKSEYNFAVKKAIVDFVLGDSLQYDNKKDNEKMKIKYYESELEKLKKINGKWKYK